MANWNTLKTAVADVINANGNQAITGQLLQNVLNNIITNVGENATFAGIATLDTNPGAPDGPVFYLTATAGAYPNFNGIEVQNGEATILLWNNNAWSKKVTGFATQEKLSELGSYVSNPEYVRAYTDAGGRFLWGIKHDGSIEWAKGVPRPIKEYIANVDLKNNKTIEQVNTLIVELMAELSSLNNDVVSIKNNVSDLNSINYTITSNEEYIYAIIDKEGRMLFGIKRDGLLDIPKLPTNIKDELGKKVEKAKGKTLIDSNVANVNSVIFSNEFIRAIVDVNNRLIEAVMADGSKFLPLPTNQDVEVLNITQKHYENSCKISDVIMRENYSVRYANSVKSIGLKSYVGDNQNVHPKVLYFKDKVFGHHYWMAYTPYPFSNDFYENPCLAYSDDGYVWHNITANPIANTPNGGYNSDTHLVYRDDLRILECWYREVVRGESEIIYRRITSDGFQWSDAEKVFQIPNAERTDMLLSPSIIYKDGMYHIWVVEQTTDRGLIVKYYQSNSGYNWNYIRDINISFNYNTKDYTPWHIDVIWHDEQYYLLANCQNGEHWVLFLSESSDNVSYNNSDVVILPRKGSWDEQLYRATIVPVADSLRIYYSARTFDGVWGIGISESHEENKFVGINK